MTDLLDGDEFYELMQAYRWSEMPVGTSLTTGAATLAFEDVKNYIRIHCVVPQGAVVIQEQDKSVPW